MLPSSPPQRLETAAREALDKVGSQLREVPAPSPATAAVAEKAEKAEKAAQAAEPPAASPRASPIKAPHQPPTQPRRSPPARAEPKASAEFRVPTTALTAKLRAFSKCPERAASFARPQCTKFGGAKLNPHGLSRFVNVLGNCRNPDCCG